MTGSTDAAASLFFKYIFCPIPLPNFRFPVGVFRRLTIGR